MASRETGILHREGQGGSLRSILFIPVLFALASSALYMLSKSFPKQSSFDDSVLKFPSSIEDLNAISSYLKLYLTDHFSYVFVLFCCAYIYKQTFAVPGSVFLNILAGAIFGSPVGFPLVCFLCASGATFCFLLSRTFGKGVLTHYFPSRVHTFQTKINENSDSLFFYLLFLRLFPMSPNWFMNMVAPIIGVPLQVFFMSVFIGLMPYNFICVRTGVMLSQVSSLDDVFTVYTILQLFIFAVVALVPGIVIKRIHDNHQQMRKQE